MSLTLLMLFFCFPNHVSVDHGPKHGDKQIMAGRVDPLRGGSNYFRRAAIWLDYICRKKNKRDATKLSTPYTTNSPPLKKGRIPKGNNRLPIFQTLYFSGASYWFLVRKPEFLSVFFVAFAAIPTEPKNKNISKWHVEPFRREPPWQVECLTHRGSDRLWNGGFLSVFVPYKSCFVKVKITLLVCVFGFSDQISRPQKGNIHININMYSTIIWLIWHINTYYILICVDGRNPQKYTTCSAHPVVRIIY